MPLLLLFCLPCRASSAFRRTRKQATSEEAAVRDPPGADPRLDRHPTLLGSDVQDDDTPLRKKPKADEDEPDTKTSGHHPPKAEGPVAAENKRRPPEEPPQRGWAGIALCLFLVGVGFWLYRRRRKPRDRFPADQSLLVSEEYY
jgi:cbb3-type cytochrome oxidase subunit 3